MDESLINAAKAGDRNHIYELLMQIPDQRLINAAQIGDVHHLYDLLRQDPLILEVYDHIPFVDTPLHVAISYGQLYFVVEMVNLKPSFTKKLNQDGFSPLHLAAINGNIEIVRKLLRVDKNLCFLKGRDDKIPLHCAVENERVNVLDLLISTCSNSVMELTVRGETVLHLAVKYNRLEAFKTLVERLHSLKMTDIRNWKDQEGNTILHLAISLRQLKMVEILLLCHCCKSVGKAIVNTRNARGLTALDLFRELAASQAYNNEHLLLQRVGNILGSGTNGPKRCKSCTPTSVFGRILRSVDKKLMVKEDTPSDEKNALLVILALIVTATFDSSVTPSNELFESFISNKPNTNTTTNSNPNDSLSVSRIIFEVAEAANHAGFILSLFLIYNLTYGFPLCVPVRIALMFMLINYLSSTWVNAPGPFDITFPSVLLIILAMHSLTRRSSKSVN